MKQQILKLSLCFVLLSLIGVQVQAGEGQKVIDTLCAGCHGAGLMGAPKFGTKSDWEPRLAKGYQQLVKNAIDGIKLMPARGGNPNLSDEVMVETVDIILKEAGLSKPKGQKYQAEKPQKKASKAAKTKTNKSTDKNTDKKVASKKTGIKQKKAKKVALARGANKFNRLMKGRSEWNPDPAQDGIHDPDNDTTDLLQTPREAFVSLPKNPFGNHVDWVKALDKELIKPRYDRLDETKEPLVMDLNIVREVKGSMPDVVYPHKQHTEWLDCSNCHPAIFVPQKGANSMSMASILMGKQCGVCHGKVAFPVSECRRCHSKKKAVKVKKR